MTGDLTPADVTYLRAAIDLARRSRHRGNHPFGALLADTAGVVAAEAEKHRRLRARRHRARGNEPGADREPQVRHTAAGARCIPARSRARCAPARSTGARISRVVYGLSEAGLLTLTGSHKKNPTMSLPCRDVFAHGQGSVTVVGPALEDEARSVHDGFWN